MKKRFIFLILALVLLPAVAFAQSDDVVRERLNGLLTQYRPPAPTSRASALPAMTSRRIELLAPGAVFQACAMPSTPHDQNGHLQPYAMIGVTGPVWGRATGGTLPYAWSWNFGDGTPPVTGTAISATAANYINAPHAYASMGTYHATLTMTDATNATSTAVVDIAVDQDILEFRTNAAIQAGLAYLYRSQLADGRWAYAYTSGGNEWAATGAALLAFHLNQHYRANDPCADIYAGTVKAGIDFLLSQAVITNVTPGVYPDLNSDSMTIRLSGGFSGYGQGMAMMGLSSGQALDYVAPSGAAVGRTVRKILEDAAEQCYMAQAKGAGYRGGWRYYIERTDGDADNSNTQWPVLGLLALQEVGIPIAPQCVSELAIWTATTQCASGGYFGYYASGYGACGWPNIAKTSSGLLQLALEGKRVEDPSAVAALGYANAHWLDAGDAVGYAEQFNGNLYAMYSMAKTMRTLVDSADAHLTLIGTHDWETDYRNYLLYNPTYKQAADGSWPSNFFTAADLSTAFGVLTLTPANVICRPVAQAVVTPNVVACNNVPVHFDGSSSLSQCQGAHIIDYRWIWDVSKGVDWNHPDATGAIVDNLAGYTIPPGGGTVTAALRVMDDYPPGGDARTAVAYKAIALSDSNHPPVACLRPGCALGPPYAGRVGENIVLDGSHSYDPDACRGDSIAQYFWDDTGTGTWVLGGKMHTVSSSTVRQWQVGLKVCDTHGVCGTSATYVYVYAAEKNLRIGPGDVTLDPVCYVPCGQATLTIKANVHFETQDSLAAEFKPATVDFYDGSPDSGGVYLGSQPLPSGVLMRQVYQVSLTWAVTAPNQQHTLYVKVDPTDQVPEWNELDNLAWVTQPLPPTVPQLTLAPPAATHNVGERDTVTATLVYLPATAIPGATVGFRVFGGPHAGITGSAVTDTMGHARFSFAGTKAGTDSVVANYTHPVAGFQSSNVVLVTWVKSTGLHCETAYAEPSVIKRADLHFVPIAIKGITDDSGHRVNVKITGITQDEAVTGHGTGRTCPDGKIGPDSRAWVRAERARPGNGRVYEISFTAWVESRDHRNAAVDGEADPTSVLCPRPEGVSCSGTVRVCVAPDSGCGHPARDCVDDGQTYNSMQRCSRGDIDEATDVTALDGAEDLLVPAALSLRVAGSASSQSTLEYGLPEDRDVRLSIFDVSGRCIATLVGTRQSAGFHRVTWTATGVRSGVYFCHLRAGAEVLTKSVVVLK